MNPWLIITGGPPTFETRYTSVSGSCSTDSGLRKPETTIRSESAAGVVTANREASPKATEARRKEFRVFMRVSPFSLNRKGRLDSLIATEIDCGLRPERSNRGLHSSTKGGRRGWPPWRRLRLRKARRHGLSQ